METNLKNASVDGLISYFYYNRNLELLDEIESVALYDSKFLEFLFKIDVHSFEKVFNRYKEKISTGLLCELVLANFFRGEFSKSVEY